MYSLFGLVLVFYSLNIVWATVPFEDCGSNLGSIESLDITDCTATPCKFVAGHSYTVNIRFKATASSKTASVKLYGK
jgi:hypothetical protein